MLLVPLQTSDGIRVGPTSNYTALLSACLQVADIACIAFAGVGAHWLRFARPLMIEDLRIVVIGVLFSALVFASSSVYRDWRAIGLAAESLRVLRMWTIAFAATVILAVGLKFANELSRIWWALWYIFGVLGVIGLRLICRRLALHFRKAGLDVRTAVVVGDSPLAERVVTVFNKEQWAGVHCQGWFSSKQNDLCSASTANPGVPHLGGLERLASYVQEHHTQEVWLALPLSEQVNIDKILWSLRHSTANIFLVPDLFGLRLLNQSIGQVAGLPVISLQQSPFYGRSRFLKAVEDRVLSLLILLVISPLLLIIALAVKMSSPGPVFYRQERVSWNNRRFTMLKFRSMPVNTEAATGALWARPGENRATKVGAVLRKTSLDELPQFFNVLFGQMSIVGPRPERPVFVEQFKDEIPNYMKKHMVKAGITGWAQVNGWRGSTDLQKRIEFDMFYIENWSLSLDARIIFETIFKGFINKNAY